MTFARPDYWGNCRAGEPTGKIKVDSYGDMIAKIFDMELVSYEEVGDYQGNYLAVLKDKDRLFYFYGYFGSCGGCDWIEAERNGATGEVDYKAALDFCQQMKPSYIVPDTTPLDVKHDGDHFLINGRKWRI
jgi:hypothetical protein